MEFVQSFFTALTDLSNTMAIYILFGMFFAGILHELIPDTLVKEHLGSDTVGSVVKATLFGVPLPICSCGVIPLATGIHKSGASKGATLSFLISTPITGADSILATFGMFGWAFTIYRLITSVIIAMIAGILTNLFEKKASATQNKGMTFSAAVSESHSCCATHGSCSTQAPVAKTKFSFIKALHYGFVTLFKDISQPLFWGLLLGALITILVPENLAQYISLHSWMSYLIVVAFAVPMYVCATASLPIAAALMLSGVSAGAAFVFLTAGPATNTVTIGVVKKMLGKRALIVYLSTLIFGSMLFGLGLDTVFAQFDINVKALIDLHEHTSIYEKASALMMWGMMGYFLLKKR